MQKYLTLHFGNCTVVIRPCQDLQGLQNKSKYTPPAPANYFENPYVPMVPYDPYGLLDASDPCDPHNS